MKMRKYGLEGLVCVCVCVFLVFVFVCLFDLINRKPGVFSTKREQIIGVYVCVYECVK